MYRIRYINTENKEVITYITNLDDLYKITKEANSIIECRIGDNMPTYLHNAIYEHNKKVK